MDDIKESDSTGRVSGGRSNAITPSNGRGSAPQLAETSSRKRQPPWWAWKWIESVITTPTTTSKQRCQDLGLSESSLYRWLRKPWFAAWLNEQCAAMVQAHLGFLHAATMRYAIDGNAAYARLAYDRFDNKFCPKERHLIQPQAPPMVITVMQEDLEGGGLLSRLPRSADGKGVVINMQPAKGPQWDDGPPEEL